jgi:hypothetical protein
MECEGMTAESLEPQPEGTAVVKCVLDLRLASVREGKYGQFRAVFPLSFEARLGQKYMRWSPLSLRERLMAVECLQEVVLADVPKITIEEIA